jgi:HEAT repeat protein
MQLTANRATIKRIFGAVLLISGIFLAVLAGSVCGEETLDDLVRALSGKEESSRVEARQHLASFGVEAIRPLIPLVDDENLAISKPACDVLMDIANEVSAPGRDAERREACELFMSMLAESQPERTRTYGLGLLSMTVPAGFDVAPIAALLRDPQYRETARVTLERIGSPEAVQALRACLRDADAGFTCALLNSLGMLGDSDSVTEITGLTRHDDEAIRLAAARALARIGDSGSESAIAAVVQTATEKSRAAAADSLLLFADTVVRKRGDKATAQRIYMKMLESADEEPLRCAALVGLGTVGDTGTVHVILDVVDASSENVTVRSTAVEALKRLDDEEVSSLLRREYRERPLHTCAAIVEVLGSRGDPESLPLLVDAAESREKSLRLAAVRALGELGDGRALDTLAEAAQSALGEERTVAVGAVAELADRLRTRGEGDTAGEAYAHLLELASDDPMRMRALRGIAFCPVPHAASSVLTHAENPELKEESVAALAAVAAVLERAGEERDALRAYEKLYALGPSIDQMRPIVQRLKRLGSTVDVARGLGFVTAWWLIGPFSDEGGEGWGTNYVGEPDVNLNGRYSSGDERVAWKRHVTSDEMGKVDLLATIGKHDHVVAYAYTEIEVAEECDAALRLGVDDGVRCWLNGEQIWDNYVNRPLKLDEDKPECRLKAGVNRILLKISQNNMGWEFCVRVTTPDDAAIPFVQRRRSSGE